MRLTKEVWLVIAIVGFLLSWLIDRLAGPVNIAVRDPIAFLTSSFVLKTYPFTATAIAVRSISLVISTILVVSLIMERRYFTKALILFFLGMLAEFFAIQQLATGFKIVTVQWTLSIAYGSVALIIGIVWMVLKGIWAMFNKSEEPKEKKGADSILEPHKED